MNWVVFLYFYFKIFRLFLQCKIGGQLRIKSVNTRGTVVNVMISCDDSSDRALTVRLYSSCGFRIEAELNY